MKISSYKFLIFLVIIISTHLSSGNLHSQVTSVGREFWLGFMSNHPNYTPNLYVFLSSDRLANGTISIPNNNFTRDFTILPNTSISIQIPTNQAHIRTSEQQIRNMAVHVLADEDINCYAMNNVTASTDGTLILPVPALGNNYIVNTYSQTTLSSELLIVATQNNTVITINPSCPTRNLRPANLPFTITLQAGDAYQVQSGASRDLTGTRVFSNGNNFALFAGNQCTVIPAGFAACDHIFEQMLPVSTWRNDYIAVALSGRENSSYRILARNNSTNVQIDGINFTTLQQNQFVDRRLSSSHYISANNPISVAQFSEGSGTDGADSDPFMIMLSPVDQKRNNVTFNVFNLNRPNTNYFLNVAIQTSCTTSVLLDDNPIASNFVPLPSRNSYSIAQVPLNVGVHTLTSSGMNCGFNAYIYGFGSFDSYGYSAGVRLDPITLSEIDTVLCVDEEFDLKVESSPYPISKYSWDFGDGESSSDADPAHSYSQGGMYDIKLSITYAANNMVDSSSFRVRVIEPEANFRYTGGGCVKEVHFFDSSLVNFGNIESRSWDFGDGETSSEINPVHSYNEAGVYKVILEINDEEGCIDYDTIEVEIFPQPIADAGEDIELCSGDSINIGNENSNPNWKYEWTPAEGLSSDTVSYPGLIPEKSGTYHLKVTNEYGCEDEDSVEIIIKPSPRLDIEQDIFICAGGRDSIGGYAIDGIEPYTYEWTPEEGLSETDVARPEASPVETTEFTVKVTGANGCYIEKKVTVHIEPIPNAVAGPDQFICYGDTVRIGGDAFCGVEPFEYEWTPSEGLSNPSISTPDAYPLATTEYIVKVTDGINRNAWDTVIVTVNPEIFPDAGDDSGICYGSSIEIGNEAKGGTPPYEYKWTPESNLSSSKEAVVTASPLETTKYHLEITDANGCQAYDSIEVEVYPLPEAFAGSDTIVCAGTPVLIGSEANSGTPPYEYSWEPVNDLENPDDATPVATPSKTTKYILTVTDSNGCTAVDSVIIEITPIPTAVAGPDITICYGESVKIGGEAFCGLEPYTYSWSPAEDLSAVDIAEPVATPESDREYIVTVTDDLGRIDRDTIKITVNSLPEISPFGEMQICSGDTINIGNEAAGNGPFNYYWMPEEHIISTQGHLAEVCPGQTTTYYQEVVDTNGCISYDTVTVTVNELPEVAISGEHKVCLGNSVELSADVSGGTPAYSYIWTPEFALDNPTTKTIVGSPLTNTTYSVEVTDANGCISEAEYLVEIIYPQSTLKIDTLFANPKERNFHIPVYLLDESDIYNCDPEYLSLELEWDMTLFNPTGVTSGTFSKKLLPNKNWNVEIFIPVTEDHAPGEAVCEIIGDVMLGKTDTTEIQFINATWGGISDFTGYQNGMLIITDLCEEGGKRLLDYREAGILAIIPNPADNEVEVTIKTTGGNTKEVVSLVDPLGRIVSSQNPEKEPAETGKSVIKSLTFDTTQLPSGIYYVRFSSANAVTAKELVIMK